MTSLDNSRNGNQAEVVTEILNVTEGEEALELARNDNSKSLDISQASVESESLNSEGMDTTPDSSSESALQSPDSAIGGTPTLTPDQEFQHRLPEKPDAEVKPIEEAVQESVKIDQNFTTTDLESQNGSDVENQNISIISNVDQTPQDPQQTEVKTLVEMVHDKGREDEFKEKYSEEPVLKVTQTELQTSAEIANDKEREDELQEITSEEPVPVVMQAELKTSAEIVDDKESEDKLQEKSSEESVSSITQKSLEADVSVVSDAGYEEDDEGMEEEEISENELVVSASMQFPLAEKIEQKENIPGTQEQLEQEEHPISEDITTSESISGVTVQVSSQISLPPPKGESPSGFESDVEDNDEEDSKEESPVPLSKSVLETTSQSSSSMQLPDTVSRLDTPEGSSVFLVGTAHFSKESQDDVANTIRIVKPDIVVVELCKARTAILQLDEETILQESRSLDFKKIQMILRQHGKIQGVLYLLLLSVSAHITKQLGMAPGGEFRTAFAEARKSAPGCLIQLGDRPIQITLSRALASLSLWHKFKLTWHILTSKEPISKEEVEKCKQRDFIEEMLAEMTGQFPAISEVFVKERDLYLCRSLQAAAQPVPNPMSPTGISPRVVVGVVGIGHVPGIVEHWGKVTDADIAPIMRIPPPSFSSKLLKFTFKMTMYGLLGYGAYKCLPTSAKSAINSSVHTAITSVTSVMPQKWQK